MASAALGGLFEIEPVSTSFPKPSAARAKPEQSGAAPTAIELDQLTRGKRNTGPAETLPSFSPKGSTTDIENRTPNELESSRPSSPEPDEGVVSQMQSWNNPRMNIWRILSICFIYLGNGLNDSAPGALIPYMEKYFHIGYAVVALIFVGNALGFITAAFLTNPLLLWLGRAKVLIFSELIMIGAYIILVVTPPFAAVVVSFFLTGLGMGINLALNNVFCANINPPTAVSGASHGSYGIGGTIAPIIATTLVSRGELWSRFYFIPLALRVYCAVFAGWAFWTYDESNLTSSADTASLTLHDRTSEGIDETSSSIQTPSRLQSLKQALKTRTTIFGALFLFAYQGAEVSISGWVISFLISYRNGDPKRVGYVTAGFWAGITLGRFFLTPLSNRYISTYLFIYILLGGTAILQVLSWLIPSLHSAAITICILGVLLGPVYPCAQTIFAKTMPRQLQTISVGFIAGAGSSGGAVAPWTTGLLAQSFGTWVLHPVCLGMYVVMVGCWVGIPRVKKRAE